MNHHCETHLRAEELIPQNGNHSSQGRAQSSDSEMREVADPQSSGIFMGCNCNDDGVRTSEQVLSAFLTRLSRINGRGEKSLGVFKKPGCY